MVCGVQQQVLNRAWRIFVTTVHRAAIINGYMIGGYRHRLGALDMLKLVSQPIRVNTPYGIIRHKNDEECEREVLNG